MASCVEDNWGYCVIKLYSLVLRIILKLFTGFNKKCNSFNQSVTMMLFNYIDVTLHQMASPRVVVLYRIKKPLRICNE